MRPVLSQEEYDDGSYMIVYCDGGVEYYDADGVVIASASADLRVTGTMADENVNV